MIESRLGNRRPLANGTTGRAAFLPGQRGDDKREGNENDKRGFIDFDSKLCRWGASAQTADADRAEALPKACGGAPIAVVRQYIENQRRASTRLRSEPLYTVPIRRNVPMLPRLYRAWQLVFSPTSERRCRRLQTGCGRNHSCQ